MHHDGIAGASILRLCHVTHHIVDVPVQRLLLFLLLLLITRALLLQGQVQGGVAMTLPILSSNKDTCIHDSSRLSLTLWMGYM